MSPLTTVQGRAFRPADLTAIQQWLEANPQGSRYQLSRYLCQRWDWRNGVGQWKDMAARSLLLKLEQRGWVRLPPRRMASPNRHRLGPVPTRCWDQRPVRASLEQLQPLSVREVSEDPAARAEVRSALASFHYLGYRQPVGENLQYELREATGRLLAALVFGAAAWQCAARDQWIGWSAAQREQGLALVANNCRYLLFPWVQVRHLASWLLSRVTRRIARDWQSKYGHPVRLLETFVERGRFVGTSYRAAHWLCVGATRGRSRQDRHHRLQVAVKDVYVYPLATNFRQKLCR